MVIDERILLSKGAISEEYNIADLIFTEGDVLKYYYQILEGTVKLNNYTDNGKETLQHIVEKGNSIGEYLLFLENAPSPINAIALTPCRILRLPKISFFNLLNQHPEICFEINQNISQKLYFRQIMAKNISTQSPSIKLKALLDYLKSQQPDKTPFSFQVPLTRQEMANYTGLSVETTIKTIKTMEKNNLVKILNRKILY
ncbi:Crp/Fnr family transcriptional regulator [Epilithonimonas xixisoli]|uniref:CRP-like cAMP-binding protein n=1 Tax=Epilithonimonas xixisoli TaxID=1476462 RepID=A0A4R8I419_9FLAO|nr:Crp/Fnr family transcriptional regulator [Epilithonimonas xixisoli]TDX83054.1 CRP-like cAMP-binding protein [Epilithonimonas xixisoli]